MLRMPKYIRTKDEILKALDTDYMCGVKVYHTEKGMITEKLVLKQSDNLAELCDEFVVEFEDKNHIVYSQFKWAMDKAMWSGMPFIIYGAVWTSKGLIYVAKMNDEGKLVLI